MKTIKIIDLLNKIANGKEVPKEIYYKKQWWKYNPENDYEGTNWRGCFLNNVLICDLNDEVETLEEKEIEKVSVKTNNHNVRKVANKINELIDAVNELKRGN